MQSRFKKSKKVATLHILKDSSKIHELGEIAFIFLEDSFNYFNLVFRPSRSIFLGFVDSLFLKKWWKSAWMSLLLGGKSFKL